MFNQLRVSGCTVDKASVQHRGDTVSNTVSTPVFDPVFEPVFETGHVSYFASVHSLEKVERVDQCLTIIKSVLIPFGNCPVFNAPEIS